ncbi:hypothetical protein ACFV4P_29475 [Kitasatospora sp. NPDC059795]|uniref:hypothetical protein n=1 Tax=Kitasatospora sp. NPDC059795 TaxID=3346949 RepID=UPI0036694FDB
MGAVIGWLVAIVAAGAAVAAWHWLRYPGHWRFAFEPRHADRRRDLDTHRRRLCTALDVSRRAVDTARVHADGAAAAYRGRVGAAERTIERLRDPGRGPAGETLGPLRLFTYRLVLTVDGRTTDHPLDLIWLDTADAGHVHLVLPDGDPLELPLPPGEFTEEQVQAFVVAVRNGVAFAKRDRPRREAQLPAAEAALAEARADTAAMEQARERLAEVRAEEDANPKVAGAEEGWEAACDRWQKLTGVRPRRPRAAHQSPEPA